MYRAELLIKEVRNLPPRYAQEVLDFASYLRQKYAKKPSGDSGVSDECPLDHTPTAVTEAAIAEGWAVLRGEVPAKRYDSIEKMLDALHS
jgi:hypothetical protein